MNEQEARKLRIGNRVMWNGHEENLGTVKNLHANGAYIKWDDGYRGWLFYDDMPEIDRAPIVKPKRQH